MAPTDRLAEADATGDGAETGPTTAESRAAALAARQVLAQLLGERVALLGQADAAIARAVDDALGRVLADLAQQPSDYQLWQLPRLLAGLTRIADDLAQQVTATGTQAAGQAWALGERMADAPLAAGAAAAAGAKPAAPAAPGLVATLAASVPPAPAAPASAPAPSVPAAAGATAGLGAPDVQQLRAVQVMTTAAIKGATARTVELINAQLHRVVLGAQSPFEAQQAIAALLPDRTANQLRAIVQLSIGQAMSTATHRRMLAQAARDPDIRKMWRRSGKRHARWNHDAIDGQVQPVADPFTLQDGHKPGRTVQLMHPHDPAGPVGETINCGCTVVPWKATWAMRHSGAKPYTPAERAARGLGKPEAKASPAPPAPRAPATTQATALAAFGAKLGQAPAVVRDVTGQSLVVDARLFDADPGPAQLRGAARNLAAYWAVQTVRRPTEVLQRDRIDMGTVEVLAQREFIRRFEAAGQAWVASFTVENRAGQWVATAPWRAHPAARARAAVATGVRVWPRR